MDYEKQQQQQQQSRDGEACKGVIKKLFPSKRYGFAVCECDKHTGEAHFNYSDLDLPEQERSCLIVGWRIEFNVIEQHKKTDHCDYRAIQVKPVNVMVVQCEFCDIWENETAVLTCRELAGKTIYVTKDKYNGKFEMDAITRRDTCRAAVTWEEIKQKKTVAIHCSQDTISPTTGSPYRPKFKTPEKRTRRDGHSFSDTTTSTNMTDDIFGTAVCEQINQTFTRSHDSGLMSPDEHQSLTGARTLGAPLVKGVRTSTPKMERFSQVFESGKFSSMTKTSPSHNNAGGGMHCSYNNNNSNSTGHSNVSHIKNNSSSSSSSGNNCIDTSSGSAGSNHMLRHSFPPGENSFRDSRSASSRRNLDREFEFLTCGKPQEPNKKAHSPSPNNSVYLDTTKFMSLLTLNGQAGVDDTRSSTPTSNQGSYSMNSVFGLYDANREHDEMNVYSGRNQSIPGSSFKSPWETSQNSLIPQNVEQQQQLDSSSHRRSLEKVDLLSFRHSSENYFG